MSFVGEKEDTIKERCYSLMFTKQTHKKRQADKQIEKRNKSLTGLLQSQQFEEIFNAVTFVSMF